MLRLVAIVVLLVNCARAELKFTLVKNDNVSDQQSLMIEKFFQDTRRLLPESILESLDEIPVSFERLDSQKEIIPPCVSETMDHMDETLGKASVQRLFSFKSGDRISLNKNFISVLSSRNFKKIEFSCGHKTKYLMAVATLIHEVIHLYDFKNNISDSRDFLQTFDFKKTIFGIKSKNTKGENVPDEYSFYSPKESFAVNTEYFLMDPEFKCRMPRYYQYLSEVFNYKPFENYACEINYKIKFLTTLLDLDPKRIYAVEYLLAGTGKKSYSRFGHSMVKLVICNPKRMQVNEDCRKDELYHIVIGYVGDMGSKGKEFSMVDGLLGRMPGKIQIIPFELTLFNYNQIELRDLKAYPLSLSREEIKEFVDSAIQDYWSYESKYNFLFNNCSTEAKKYFFVESSFITTPKSLLKVFQKMDVTGKNFTDYPLFSDNLLEFYERLKMSSPDLRKDILGFVRDVSPYERAQIYENYLNTFSNYGSNLNLEMEASRIHTLEKKAERIITYYKTKKIVLKMIRKNKQLAPLILEQANNVMDKDAIKEVVLNRNYSYGIPLDGDMDIAPNFKQELKILLEEETVDTVFKNLENFPLDSGDLKKIQDLKNELLEVRENLKNALSKM